MELASHNISASQKADDYWNIGEGERLKYEDNLYTHKEQRISTVIEQSRGVLGLLPSFICSETALLSWFVFILLKPPPNMQWPGVFIFNTPVWGKRFAIICLSCASVHPIIQPFHLKFYSRKIDILILKFMHKDICRPMLVLIRRQKWT